MCDSFLGEGGGRGLMNCLDRAYKPLPAITYIPAAPLQWGGDYVSQGFDLRVDRFFIGICFGEAQGV